MTNRYLLTIAIILFFVQSALAQSGSVFSLKGKVLDSRDGQPLPGALIQIDDTGINTVTDNQGNYLLELAVGIHSLQVRFLGYHNLNTTIEVPLSETEPLELTLEPDQLRLEEVEVISTGYQELPKERATGSFVQLDNELINRRVSTNLIDRLEDVTPGLIFNRTGPANDPISIRGRNTLFADTQPLVIIDNFPYDGPLDNINPNDVESITVLRDAAAASIWGARAGNGVIVITTRQGAESPPRISFNSNINFIEKPDLFYGPQMAMNDFIDLEKMLFNRGVYNARENNISKPPLSPGVETLIAGRDGLISQEEVERRLNSFRQQDVRRDFTDYFYRPTVNRQYSLSLTGGTKGHRYFISGGYDHNTENITGNNNNRITLNVNNSWKLVNDKLDLGLGLYYARQENSIGTVLPSSNNYFPYDRLVDENGTGQIITQNYNRRFIENQLHPELLDWNYIPFDEIGRVRNINVGDDYRINFSAAYRILPGLSAELKYQYWQNTGRLEDFREEDLYFSRDLINQFTQLDPNGNISRAIPEGAIMDVNQSHSFSHNLRGQLTYSGSFGNDHELNAIGGYEVRDWQSEFHSFRFYGYEPDLAISRPVNFETTYRRYHNNFPANIPNGVSHGGSVDRFISYFANAGYTIKKRYILSASARRDASNLFGVNTNQRAVPLWSVGAGWILSEEKFFDSGWMPFLKLRASYGYNGNVDKNVSALTTALYYVSALQPNIGSLGAMVMNPPNPLLRWEKIGIANFGLDFESKDSRFRGSIEYYNKKGKDLIGDSPVPFSTGVSTFRGNYASMITKGLDLDIQSVNLNGALRWTTNFFYSRAEERVTDYRMLGTTLSYLEGAQMVPMEGRPLFSLYSLPWGGLDPNTGDPLGILNGEPSSNYATIFSEASPENIQFEGSRRPVSFGSVRNNLYWKGLSLSFNISYRLGYVYRKQALNYNGILQGNIGHPEYAQRWQQPGDEAITNVPSMPGGQNNLRNNIYRFSEIHSLRADNIRFQDIRIAYNLNRTKLPWLPFENAELYSYVNNIGIIWRASKDLVDPDFPSSRPLRSLAAGLKIDF
ncbi:SusC/RagA family TonB-linked outer membrane protein [Fontibacter flavus]|uniref:SusC/RagA family TonB-linked outer membrane protein n=1 Tax=Fontibacter flavus TaxID=654838 RepID=A0ABV6FWY6_9BACT